MKTLIENYQEFETIIKNNENKNVIDASNYEFLPPTTLIPLIYESKKQNKNLKVSKNNIKTVQDILNISSSNVKSILNIFEKTQLLHHVEAYGSPTKRVRKSWKYYFLSPTIKYSINKNFGFIQDNPNQIMGLLSEDLISSLLFQNKYYQKSFDVYYDSEKNGADFILNFMNDVKIPLEVGYGKKSLKQVYNSMERLNSPHGLLISNKTTSIKVKDNVICVPLLFFSL